MALALCNPVRDPKSCIPEPPVDAAGSVTNAAWDRICRSFADAALTLLREFADGFVNFPSVDLGSPGIRRVYAISLGLAGTVAAVLMIVQIVRTVWTQDGKPLAHGLVGLAKMAVAFMVTLSVGGAALLASNQLSTFIVDLSFGSSEGLKAKLAAGFASTGNPVQSATLLLILAVIGIALVLVLWFELLLANAAVAVMIATSPIAAAGLIGEATSRWWSKLAESTLKLIVLKPVIALVFAVGFGLTGGADGTAPDGRPTATGQVAGQLSGLLVLLLAVLAWPAIGRFFTFTSVHVGGSSGLAGLIGGASNALNGRSGGAPVGSPPGVFGRDAESRTMMSFADRGGFASGGSGGGAALLGGGSGAALAVLGKGLDLAQRGANSLVGRSEQIAGHGGLPGASPFAYPASYPRHAPPGFPSIGSGEAPPSTEPPQAPPPAPPPPPANTREKQ